MSDAAPAGVNEQKPLDEQTAPQSQEEREKSTVANETQAKNGQLSMQVRIHSPFRIYYDGPAFSLSAENATGPFDILPRHHNFISLLTACEIVVRTADKGDQRIRISGGLMHVKADQVIVFLDV